MPEKELPISLYKELEAQVRHDGLFRPRYGYYVILFMLLCSGLAVSVYLLLTAEHFFVHVFNALLLAFITVQFGMLGHDLSHKQVFGRELFNRIGATLVWTLVAGMSENKWYGTHNAHHKEVNHSEHDPDLDMPFIFQEEQVPFKEQRYRVLRMYQGVIFFLVLPLVYPVYILRSFTHNLHVFDRKSVLELLLMAVHYVIFLGLVFLSLPLLTALTFLTVFALASGFYMGLVFAPNHKGMPMVAEDERVLWWHQIACTRNLYPNTLVFHLMGGLNYQIEHHLFTSMPRINYERAAPTVKAFCVEYGIPYYETTWPGSLKEIYDSLQRMSGRLAKDVH